ncbi:multidrug efflux SMR transporter [Synechococcus sp. PCC 7336]|uniref:DMT family transporter n=1 Tax=Synechococcus sp. PCC 7336 TaxID=195250 RepID=UPI00034CCAC9|nr:EamA family transporter [Synechococcus sp. PCC 7336]
MRISYLLLAVSICLGAIGQIFLKMGANKADTAAFFFLEPRLLMGFGVYFCSAILYTLALKKLPLSVAFPSVSLSYAIVSILAHLIWKEPFGVRQIAGLATISLGVFLLNRNG